MTRLDDHFTPWYPGHVHPARIGVYQRRSGGDPTYALWDGARWSFSAGTVARAREYDGLASLTQDRAWRGLAQEPRA